MKPFSEIREVAEQITNDDLFPVGRAWFDRQLEGLVEVRARDVVSWARDAWDEEHARLAQVGMKPWLSKWGRIDGGPGPHPPGRKDDPAAIDRITATKVKEHVSQRGLAPDGLPANVDNWRVLVESVLARCVGNTRYELRSVTRPTKGAYHLVTVRRGDNGRDVRSALVFVAAPNANAATTALKKMADDAGSPGCRYLVSDEGRRPLKLGAVGRKTYDDLVGLGDTRFQHVKLTFQDHAELDAFEGVVGAARTGASRSIPAPARAPSRRPRSRSRCIARTSSGSTRYFAVSSRGKSSRTRRPARGLESTVSAPERRSSRIYPGASGRPRAS